MEMILTKLWRLISEQYVQYIVFLSLSVMVMILTAIAHDLNPSSFQKYFGRFHPLLVVLLSCFLGLVLFTFLLLDDQFAIYRGGNYKGILDAVGLAVPFATVIILVDRKFPFPADMNVPFPESLFFYPAIGYVVELLFHILPFCLVYFILGSLASKASNSSIIWVSILVVALIEPVFQLAYASSQDSTAVLAYVGLHLFLINLVQLLLFVRYDFISMYMFRLSYYLLWHILWGHLRLRLLF